MTVKQLLDELRTLDQDKEILARVGWDAAWHQLEIRIIECPNWPEYAMQISIGSSKEL